MAAHILIVGAGPVGLVAANVLHDYGIAIDIIDRNQTSTTYSKALSVSAATLKVFQGLGLDQTLIQAGKKVSDVHLYYQNRRFLHIDKRRLDTPHPFYLSIPQPETERVLEARLAQNGLSVSRGTSLMALRQQPHHVCVDITHLDGHSQTKTYDYVLGCDGAQSSVRQYCDIPFTGHDYDMHFIMGDVRLATQHRHQTSYHILPNGFLIFLPMNNGLVRLVSNRPGPIAPHQNLPSLPELQALLDTYYPEALTINHLEWASRALFYNRIAATNFTQGVFLLGDAHHLFSPIGGQGMNTGIQDAFNLAWKLAYFLKGLAQPALLDSYRTERTLAVEKVLRITDLDTQMITTPSRQEADPLFHPNMSLRHYYRTILPLKYSGLNISHGLDDASPVGHHVPSCALHPSSLGLTHTYDLPQTQKLILFTRQPALSTQDLLPIPSPLHPNLLVYHAAKHETQLIQKLGLQHNHHCLVRPDGYIGFVGNTLNLKRYLQQYFL